MAKNFIQRLCEAEINQTEVALATSNISGDLQSMVEKLSNIKIKDVAELVKKLKYSGDIEAGDSFNQMIGEKLDQAIQSLSDIKSSIDDEVVKISQGNLSGEASGENAGLNDLDTDFGDEENSDDYEDFDADADYGETDDLDLSDVDFGEVEREQK